MDKAFHYRDDVDRLNMSRKRGRRPISIQNSADASIQNLEKYVRNRRERLIIATRNDTNNKSINRTKITRKHKWKETQLYGHFE